MNVLKNQQPEATNCYKKKKVEAKTYVRDCIEL